MIESIQVKLNIQRIEEIITPCINTMGFDVIQVAIIGGNLPTLQIMVDHNDGRAISVDDCTRIIRTLSLVLDVEDPLTEKYRLEVSSPGIDRPLIKLKDFRDWIGFDACIDLAMAIEGRRQFNGRIKSVNEYNQVQVELKDNARMVDLPFEEILQAKLVLTDELIESRCPSKQN
ncbi:ribosome maturation domain protein [Candidatus Endolissoclinum faulkneri L2]|uniref:Ribosome maturation factor RimP n=1 Tax=Candidatus Endolissoclinum faulkneri L2 TaxID=1193729 RepID=K7Z2T4_9PROT|nr:ribosome maturation factor RimP [Candidatus Endolissoclinum faulkneri]AFX98283.1 ribosome maturation domain protein [Candidatus Endolissoclinum faulkneri L2]